MTNSMVLSLEDWMEIYQMDTKESSERDTVRATWYYCKDRKCKTKVEHIHIGDYYSDWTPEDDGDE